MNHPCTVMIIQCQPADNLPGVSGADGHAKVPEPRPLEAGHDRLEGGEGVHGLLPPLHLGLRQFLDVGAIPPVMQRGRYFRVSLVTLGVGVSII